MIKYVMYIDYCSNSFEYVSLDGIKDIYEAISFVDHYLFKAKDENIYLVRILEKTGKTVKQDDISIMTYKAVLCKRTLWHKNDEAHGEQEHIIHRHVNSRGDERFVLCDKYGNELM